MTAAAPIRLTSFSHGAGCACKLGSTDLTKVLEHLPKNARTDILVDAATRDDAAVVKIAPDRALIATVDFFTPIVDNPRDWGAIAAANAVSDVYAMGGRPLFALSLVGWPREKIPFELLGQVLEGAAEILERAACPTVGGHSIDDPEPKFGLAVIGEAHPERVLTNAGGKAGHVLLLTKPLGTGILTTALKRNEIGEEGLAEAVHVMTTLNDKAAEVALAHDASTATDITGFGLLGHLSNITRASNVGALIDVDSLPYLKGARELAARGVVPGGTKRNREAVEVAWAADVEEPDRWLLADAQTSGGLLFAVPEDQAKAARTALEAAGMKAAKIVGRLTAEPGIRVERSMRA
jgi:selenide,water dikinase